MSGKRSSVSKPTGRRRFTREFKEEEVQMLLDGHPAESVASRLGLNPVAHTLLARPFVSRIVEHRLNQVHATLSRPRYW